MCMEQTQVSTVAWRVQFFQVSRMETSLKCLILRILASVASDISDRTKEEDLKLLSQLSNNGARYISTR